MRRIQIQLHDTFTSTVTPAALFELSASIFQKQFQFGPYFHNSKQLILKTHTFTYKY